MDDAGVDRAVRGEPEASDHAPAWVSLRPDRPTGRTTRRTASPQAQRAGVMAVGSSGSSISGAPAMCW